MTHPIRLLLAKIGLDGHDRGVKLLARSFRDAGLEVIYTGLWQTSVATIHAAMQEDVDVVGVSLHSAAHMTIMPELIRLKAQYGVEDIPLVLGGIVPMADYPALTAMGVDAVFNPGSSITDILARIRELAARRPPRDVAGQRRGYQQGDQRSMARLITHLQRSGLDGFAPQGRGKVVGVTGAPGVGKSSFIAKLARSLRNQGLKVAVVAVDPTSPITGGALLGDRLRMMRQEPDEQFFVRSLASGGTHGGLGPRVREVIELLSGFGFDIVLLETVGAGQSDTAILDVTRCVLLVVMPDSGDDVQFSKAGLMEIASAYVINKCDLPGADATEAGLRSSVPADRPVWRVSALHDQGLDQVARWLVDLPARS
jgi:LAO/AO transport system ATPase